MFAKNITLWKNNLRKNVYLQYFSSNVQLEERNKFMGGFFSVYVVFILKHVRYSYNEA